jgi:hypothetical protein
LHLLSKRVVTNDESLEHEDLMAQFKKKKISFYLLFHHNEIDENGEANPQLINEIDDLPDVDVGHGESEGVSAKLQPEDAQHADMAAFA